MIELKWYARGGQGGFTASRVFALAAVLKNGGFAQAFPSFGPERRGAPVFGFTRLDERPIRDHSQVVACDYAIVLDETLAENLDLGSGLRAGGVLLINSGRPAREFSAPAGVRVVTFDASSLARRVLGSDIANTAMMALLAAQSGLADEQSLKQAIREGMPQRLAASNMKLVEAAFAAQSAPAPDASAKESSSLSAKEYPRPALGKPALRSYKLPRAPHELPLGPSAEGGVLVEGNAGWRLRYPWVDYQLCVKCRICQGLCPEDVIDDNIGIDMDFCKGCGLCARECPRHAITMREE